MNDMPEVAPTAREHEAAHLRGEHPLTADRNEYLPVIDGCPACERRAERAWRKTLKRSRYRTEHVLVPALIHAAAVTARDAS